jgi:O-antigen ligase
MCWTLSLATLPLAFTALRNYQAGVFMRDSERIAGYNAPLTQNPNDLALVFDLILPLAVALLLRERSAGLRAVLWCVLALDAVGVVFTFSRAGFLMLASIALIYAAKLLRRGSWGLLVLLLALVVMIPPLLPGSYVERLGTITDINSDRTGSAQARWSDTVAATRFVVAHPLVGAGIGMSELALNDLRGATWKEVHNVYLQYAVDLGLPGLLLFVALLVTGLRHVRRVQRERVALGVRDDLFFIAEGIEVSLWIFAVGAMFHTVAYDFYFFIVAGLAVAARAVRDVQSSQAAAEAA